MSDINEYKLTIESQTDNETVIQTLIYRGNENISIESSQFSDSEGCELSIRFPRHVLETFMRLIK